LLNMAEKHKHKKVDKSSTAHDESEEQSKHKQSISSERSVPDRSRKTNSESDSSSSRASSTTKPKEKTHKKSEKKKSKKKKKKLKKKLKKEKRKLKKAAAQAADVTKGSKDITKPEDDKSKIAEEPEDQLMLDRAKAMAPMTKEEWEKRQSVVRRVYDDETGRHRLIKGDGEVLEEIVSRDRHREINKQATRGDGAFFQSTMAAKSRK
ncbi:hypothetical protein L9F63_009682, partial [Diploptera punctata]